MVSLDDWRGFEEVQRCLTACASPRRGKALDPTFPGLVRQISQFNVASLMKSCRDAFLRLCKSPGLRKRRFHSAPLACRDAARRVSTVRGILFRLLAFLFVETRRATSPSLAFLLAETQECVGNDRLRAQAEIRRTHIIYMRVR